VTFRFFFFNLVIFLLFFIYIFFSTFTYNSVIFFLFYKLTIKSFLYKSTHVVDSRSENFQNFFRKLVWQVATLFLSKIFDFLKKN
jgi:hypothetical protein